MRHPYAFRVQGGSEARAAERLLRFGVLAMNPHEYIRLRDNAEGKVVFIDGALPGEKVRVQTGRRKNNWEQATMTERRREIGRAHV